MPGRTRAPARQPDRYECVHQTFASSQSVGPCGRHLFRFVGVARTEPRRWCASNHAPAAHGMGRFAHPKIRSCRHPVDAGAGSAALRCGSSRVARPMCRGEDIGLGAVHMICCPRVVSPGTLTAQPTMGGGLSDESSAFWVVAFVVSA